MKSLQLIWRLENSKQNPTITCVAGMVEYQDGSRPPDDMSHCNISADLADRSVSNDFMVAIKRSGLMYATSRVSCQKGPICHT